MGQLKPAKRPYDPTTIREFQLTDGRPVALHRHSVRFATPLKDNPQNATLVAVREGEKPMPLAITYPNFIMKWWLAS